MILNTNQMIVLLIVIGLIVAFWFITKKNLIDFHLIMKEFHGRNEAIVFANVLLSSKKFMYEDGTLMHGVFDSKKLDDVNGKNIVDFGYPNAYASVVVEDVENGNKWSFYFENLEMSEKEKEKIIDCYFEFLKPSIMGISTANIWNQYECVMNQLKKGVYIDTYPVSIAYGKEVHVGKMYLTFVQVF